MISGQSGLSRCSYHRNLRYDRSFFLRLKDETLFRQAALVGGRWIAAGKDGIAVKNPATGETIGHVPNLGATETLEAIVAAENSQRQWSTRTARERSDTMRRWFGLMMDNKEDLGRILTIEQGKPLNEAINEVAYGASFIEWFAEEAQRLYGDITPGHQIDKRILIIKQPVGVVAAITPWNFPNAMVTRKVGPAIAAGCAIVLKPASQTPFSAIAIALLAERAGVPSGLFSVVTGSAREIGMEMTSSPIVRKLSFTGSTEIGSRLYANCAPTIKKLSLELGGNAPFIVFDDADLDCAVEGAILAKFRNNGQTCVCANRFYVQNGVYDTFAERLSKAASELKIGNGLDDGVALGPLIDSNAMKKVEEHVNDAVSKGGLLLTGGGRHEQGGSFYKATVLAEANRNMLLAREETFGPVAALFRFDHEDEVIAEANDTDFGLAGYFFTRDLNRVFRVAEALECGMVGVNTGLISTAEVPFGGIKSSGLGREGSKYGIEEFVEVKYICIGGID